MTKFACKETYPNQTITKTSKGFVWKLNYADLFEMYFDKEGVYLYQYQEDMIESGIIRIVSNNVEPLTKEQMAI